MRRVCEDRTWRIQFSLVYKQIIALKTKYSSIRQYKPKKPKNSGFKNLVRADISGFMYDFFAYDGKNSAELDDGKSGHLQKCAQVLTKLCDDVPGHKNYKVFFDNWFATLDLLHSYITKINAWVLYRRHFRQNGKPHKNHKSLLQFSLELSDALILASKVNLSSSSGQP